MIKKSVSTNNSPRPAGAYSQGIHVNGFLFTSGFGPQDPATGEVPEGIAAQTRQTLRNIEAVLDVAGASLGDVIKTTVHLQHLNRDFAEYNAAYAEFFGTPLPARTTVGSSLVGILIEIDVVAAVPNKL